METVSRLKYDAKRLQTSHNIFKEQQAFFSDSFITIFQCGLYCILITDYSVF